MSRPTRPRRLVAIAFCVALTATLQWTPAGAANILAMQPFAGKSQWNTMNAVLRALTDRGHNVTVFTPLPTGDRDNYVEVDVSDGKRTVTDVDVELVVQYLGTVASLMTVLINSTRSGCDAVYQHPRMVDILTKATPGEFDAVVSVSYGSECTAYVASVLGVPAIYVVPMPIVTFLERSLFGHFPNPATVAHLFSRTGVLKTFADRLANTALTVFCSCMWRYVEWRHALSDPRPYDRIHLVRPSLTFTNTHFITESSRPLPPDVVQVGGIHLAPPKQIPADILEFIEGSPHGVVYITFGSIISMSSLPDNLQTTFRDAFRSIPQRVLWKYEGDEMKDKPDNVMTARWFPQRDILLHPNVKLFINHGGISGVYEAVDAGVPVLGCPVFSDQSRNIGNLVDAGMAISVDVFSVTNDTFLNAVQELVNNESYRRNAKTASELFKDRPLSPAESVVYWTEYVIRHKGARHLKSHAIDLTWYQYFLVDVICALSVVAFIVAGVIRYGVKTVYVYAFVRVRGGRQKRD